MARLRGGHVDPGARRQRLRRGGRDGDHVADRRAASLRPRRRHAGHSLQRSRPGGARPLRPGDRAGRRDCSQVPRTRPHPDSGNRLSRGGDSGRVRRLDAAAARLRNDDRRAGAGACDRLCRERLPGSAARDDVAAAAGRILQGGMAEFGGGMAARRRAAEAGNAVSHARRRRHLQADRRRGEGGRRRSRAPDRSRARRLLSRLRRRGDRPLRDPHAANGWNRPAQRRPSHRRRHGGLARDLGRQRELRLRSLARPQDRPLGAGARAAAAARALEGIRSRRARSERRRVRACRHRMRQTRVRRSRGVLWRSGFRRSTRWRRC